MAIIVSNPDIFDFSYIPEKFMFREKQNNALEALSVTPLKGGVANAISVYGRSGTGKTATARKLL